MVILPSNNETDRDTNETEHLPNNSSRSQLLDSAPVYLGTSNGSILLDTEDQEKVAGPSVKVPSKKNKESMVNLIL